MKASGNVSEGRKCKKGASNLNVRGTYFFGTVTVLVEDSHVPTLGGGEPVALDYVTHHDAGRAHVCNRIPRYTPPRPWC